MLPALRSGADAIAVIHSKHLESCLPMLTGKSRHNILPDVVYASDRCIEFQNTLTGMKLSRPGSNKV